MEKNQKEIKSWKKLYEGPATIYRNEQDELRAEWYIDCKCGHEKTMKIVTFMDHATCSCEKCDRWGIYTLAKKLRRGNKKSRTYIIEI